MVGYSGTDAPTPFILLANGITHILRRVQPLMAGISVQTRLPQAMMLDAIQNRSTSLLFCARLLIRFVSFRSDVVAITFGLTTSDCSIRMCSSVIHSEKSTTTDRSMIPGRGNIYATSVRFDRVKNSRLCRSMILYRSRIGLIHDEMML